MFHRWHINYIKSLEEEHLKKLEEVSSRLQAHGVQLKKIHWKEFMEYIGNWDKNMSRRITAVENSPLYTTECTAVKVILFNWAF